MLLEEFLVTNIELENTRLEIRSSVCIRNFVQRFS